MSSPFDISEAEVRERCSALLNAALDEAVRLRHNYIGTEHLYNALTKAENSLAARLLREAGLDPRTVRNEIRREVGAGEDEVSSEPPLTPRSYHVLVMACYYADDYNSPEVGEAHVLLALIQDGEGVAVRKLDALNIDLSKWVEPLLNVMDQQGGVSFTAFGEEKPKLFDLPARADSEIRTPPHVERTPQSPTPMLDKFGRDLVELARKGKVTPAIGRDREIRTVARTLARNKKNNPLLLGDAGVGKTAVVEGLAYAIAEGTAPLPLLTKRIIQLEISTLVAGTSLRGQFEERLMQVVDEARQSNNNIILFIDEIHTIVGAGDTIDSNLDAANILKPVLSRGEIAVIGATTHEEYRKAILQDAALDRRFRTINIDEPSQEDTLKIIQAVYQRYADHHKVTITPEALEAAVSLSAKYLINRRQPDKSLDLLDDACARLVVQSGVQPNGQGVVTAASITEMISEWTGIPITELTSDEKVRYGRMADSLERRVRGQSHAVQLVTQAIQTNRAGLADPQKPIGVFLFLGPSGVGKTELAKAVAQFLFGSESALVRLDMSEFHDEHTVARLIGSPPGYKDSNQGGQLTEALRRKPYSVILLDEVEKAAPAIFDLFLQVFDEGRLTDARGTTYDARHAVWIMTSNIGTAETARAIGFASSGYRPPVYDQHLKRFFRPEFLNRIDEVVIFNPLTDEALNQILDLQLIELQQRLQTQLVSLRLTPAARSLLLTQGHDPQNGARPLRRTVEKLLTRALSQYLLMESLAGEMVVQVDAVQGELTFTAHTVGRAESRG